LRHLERDCILLSLFSVQERKNSVILSAAAASQSEADAESKDPLSARVKTNAARHSRETAK